MRPLPCAVEQNVLTPFHPGQQIGTGFHAAAEDHRLACRLINRRQSLLPRSEGPGCALAVHQHLAQFPVHHVPLQLGGIVRHVVDLVQAKVRRVLAENVGEHLTDAVQDHLTVGKGHIDGAIHGGKVILAFRRLKRSTGQFAIQHPDTVLALHDLEEDLQIVGRHLVTETAAAAMKHHHHLVGDA